MMSKHGESVNEKTGQIQCLLFQHGRALRLTHQWQGLHKVASKKLPAPHSLTLAFFALWLQGRYSCGSVTHQFHNDPFQ